MTAWSRPSLAPADLPSPPLTSPPRRRAQGRPSPSHPEGRTPRWRPDLRGVVLPLAMLALWWLVTRLGWVNTRLIVPPSQVFTTAWSVARDADFHLGVIYSLARDLTGFAAGALGGMLLGTAMGLSRWIDLVVGPSFHALRQISLFAWLPLLSTWLGYGELSKGVFIALSALYPVALNTFEGVRGVSQAHAEVARVYGFSRRQIVLRLVLPAAAPQIATGLMLGLVYAWVATIGAEFLLANWGHGLGNLVIKARASFNVPLIIVGMVVIGAIGTLLHRLALRLERRVLRGYGQNN